MLGFDQCDRRYDVARRDFHLPDRRDFNFAFDIVDERARRSDETAVLAVSPAGDEVHHIGFAELSAKSDRFAHALAGLEIEAGAQMAVVVGRIPAWYILILGAMKAGVVALPGTSLLTAKDIAYRLQETGAQIVAVTEDHAGKIEAIRAACPALRHLILVDGEREGWLSLSGLLAASPSTAFPRRNTRITDQALGYFTSGTTSLPKLVYRDHSYALAHAITGLFWMDLREGDVHWSLTDTGWAKAAYGMLFPQMLLGAPTVLYEGGGGFDADLHLRLITKLRVSTFCAPPTVYRMFAQLDLSHYDLSSLRRCLSAGEPLNPEVMRYWELHSGLIIADGYGQTESVIVIGNAVGEPVRAGSMGKAFPGFDVDLVDGTGASVPDGEIGQIALRTDREHPPGLFHGYARGDALDTAAFQNGAYLTGDTARRDADGYFWFVGRADDLISSAGYRISPFEVESALLEHPAVAESAVVGRPDPIRGEIVKAFVILSAGWAPSAELADTLRTFCREVTAPYKYPREIEFVTTLPKTVSGKIRRSELRRREAPLPECEV